MEEQKINLGPESPADLQWSQGAKNPRKETKSESDDDRIDMINIGTLDSDTDGDDDDDDGFLLVLKDDNETSNNDKSDDVKINNDVIGTPSGDTVASSNEQKRARENLEENNTESKKQKTEESATEYYLREKLERSKRREDERKERLVQSKMLKEEYSVHKKIYEQFLEGLNLNRAQEVEIRNMRTRFVDNIKGKAKIFNKYLKDPMIAFVCPYSNNGTVTLPQSRFIQDALMDAIVEHFKPYREDIVRFEECLYEEGYFMIRCTDLHSLQFLKTVSLQHVWAKSPKFGVLSNIDFASLLSVKITLPKNKLKDFNEFLKLIVFQNRDVDPRRWEFVRKEMGKQEIWHLKCDAVSLRYINSLGGRLYCGAGQITFNCSEKLP